MELNRVLIALFYRGKKRISCHAASLISTL